jgi:hypothetical protein
MEKIIKIKVVLELLEENIIKSPEALDIITKICDSKGLIGFKN